MIKVLIMATNDEEMAAVENMFKNQEDFKIVGKVKGGQNGIQMAERLKPDLIISNVFKDTVDEDGFITALRYSSENCKIILRIPYNIPSAVSFAMNVGVDYIMQKNTEQGMFINHCQFLFYDKIDL